MPIEKSVKTSVVSQSSREEVLVFELDVFVNPLGIDWQMAAIAWAAQKNGYKLAVVSSRNPEKYLKLLWGKWDDSKDPKQNIRVLSEIFNSISSFGILSPLEFLGIEFDHGFVEQQKQLGKNASTYLKQCIEQPEKFKKEELVSLINQSEINYSRDIKAQFASIAKEYDKKSRFYFISHSKNDVDSFEKESSFSDGIKKSFLYNPQTKYFRSEILSTLSLQGFVTSEYKRLNFLARKEKFKDSTDLCGYFWAAHAMFDIEKAPSLQESQLVNELIRFWEGAPRFLLTLLRRRYPSYAHQYLLRLIYDAYPFREADKPYQVPAIQFEKIDNKDKRGKIAKVGFEAEEDSQNGFPNGLSNNNNDQSVSSNQHFHFQMQESKLFLWDDYDGPKVEFYIERGKLLIDVALHELEEECDRLKAELSNPATYGVYQELLMKINALKAVFKDFSVSMHELWQRSGLTDDDFKDKDGFFEARKDVGERFRESFHKKAVKLIHNLVRQIVGVQILNREYINSENLQESISKFQKKIEEKVKIFRKKESEYIAKKIKRPILSHEGVIQLSDKLESRMWMYHVPVGRFTHQQLVFRFYKKLIEKLDNVDKSEIASFNEKMEKFINKYAKSPALAAICEEFKKFYDDKRDVKVPGILLAKLLLLVDENVEKLSSNIQVQAVVFPVYELIADLIKTHLGVDEYYTFPSSERNNHGSSNSLQTDAYDLDENGIHCYGSAFRDSSAPPIDLDKDKLGGESWRRLWISYTNIHQDLELYANKHVRELEKNKKPIDLAGYSSERPMVVKIAWASLLSPLGGEKMAALGSKVKDQTEYNQLLEIEIIRKIIQAAPVLVNIDGQSTWVRFEIQAINKAVNEARGLTNTFSDLQENINTEGYYKLTQTIDESLHTILSKQNFSEAQELADKLNAQLKKCQNDKDLLLKKKKISAVQREINKYCIVLNTILQKLSFQGILHPEINSKIFMEKIAKIKDLQSSLKTAWEEYLDQRKIALDDKELKKTITELEDFKGKNPKYENKNFQRVVDIFRLKSYLWQMIDGGIKIDDETCYWFVAYYLCLLRELDPLIIIKFHCKSAEDRTGTLEDYYRAMQRYRFAYGFYPSTASKNVINDIRKQLYQESPCRATTGKNAPGSTGLQVGNQFFGKFDDLIAKLAKDAFDIEISNETPLPAVVYNYPMPLNEHKISSESNVKSSVVVKAEVEIGAIEKINANIYSIVGLNDTLNNELISAKNDVAKQVFCHDLVLRFWFYLSKMAMVGSNKALFDDAKAFVEYEKNKANNIMPVFLANMLNGKFKTAQEESLADFFHEKMQEMCVEKKDYYEAFSVLLSFIGGLGEQEKNMFMTILSKSLSSDFYSSKLAKVVIDDLKVQYKKKSQLYARYILPYFYMIGVGGQSCDFSRLVEQLEMLRKNVEARKILNVDVRLKIEENWFRVQKDIMGSAANIDILAKSKKAKNKISKEHGFGERCKDMIEGLTIILSTIEVNNDNHHAAYLRDLKVFMATLTRKSHEYFANNNKIEGAYQGIISFFNDMTVDLANVLNELAGKYKIQIKTVDKLSSNNATLSLSVARFLQVLWYGLVNILPDKGEQKNYAFLIENMMGFFDIYKLSYQSCEKMMESLEVYCGLAADSDDNKNLVAINEGFNTDKNLIVGLKALPSQQAYAKVNFFESSNEGSISQPAMNFMVKQRENLNAGEPNVVQAPQAVV